MDFKTLPFELKSADGDGSTFAGYANCFNNIDAAQEIVAPGAFKDRLAELMAEGSNEVLFLGGINHQWDSPLGKVTSAREDPKGLFIEAKISQTQQGKDCMVLLKDGVLRKMSIGYKVLGAEMLTDAEDVQAYWKDVGYTPNASDIAAAQHGAKLLTKLFLYEASPVVAPANSLADITRVKQYSAAELPNKRAFEAFLRDSGLSRKEAVEAIAVLFKGLQREADEAASPETETPPAEPEPQPDETTPEETVEAKTEPEPIEAPAAVVEVIDVSKGAHQQQVQALYANLRNIQARYGLGAP